MAIQGWHEIKKVLHNKETVTRVGRQPAEWEMNVASLILSRGLIPGI